MTIRTTGAAALLALALLATACSDDGTDVNAGDGTSTSAATDAGSGLAPDGSGVTVPDRAADITGTVTSVHAFEPVTEDCTPPEDLDPDGSISSEDPPVCTPEDNDILGTILVEAQPDVQEGRKISFTITTETALTGEGPLGVFADLAEGQTVDAWTTGPCAESYPEQCGAEAVRRTG